VHRADRGHAGTQPEFGTLLKTLTALGVRLTAKAGAARVRAGDTPESAYNRVVHTDFPSVVEGRTAAV